MSSWGFIILLIRIRRNIYVVLIQWHHFDKLPGQFHFLVRFLGGGFGASLLSTCLTFGDTFCRQSGHVVVLTCFIQAPTHSLWNWWPQGRVVHESSVMFISPKQMEHDGNSIGMSSFSAIMAIALLTTCSTISWHTWNASAISTSEKDCLLWLGSIFET